MSQDIDEIEAQAQEYLMDFVGRGEWAARKGADIRAKAELMQRMDDPPEVYGTTDPDRLLAVASTLERLYTISKRGTAGVVIRD